MGGIVNTNKVIAVKPGSTVYGGGLDIYAKGADGKPKLLVQEGQFVAIDPRTQKSLDASSIEGVDKVEFAVGWGRSKYGRARELRKLSLESIDRCNITDVAAEPYSCGTSAVTDIEFDCIKADETYTFFIAVEDYISESFSPAYMPLRRYYTVNTNECTCEPVCEPTADCQELVKDYVRQINGIKKYKDDPGLHQWMELQPNENLPFYAHVRYENSFQFCLTPESAECDLCTHVPAITGINIGETLVEFEGTTDPDDSSLTRREQLLDIVDQINDELGYGTEDEKGVATLSGATGKCCDLKLEINTTESAVTLQGESDPIAPCGTEDFSGANGCAIRIVAKPVDLSCLCDTGVPDPRILNKTRNLKVDVQGQSWSCGSHRVIEVSKSTPPINLGYDWIQQDIDSAHGGSGRTHDNFNTFRGKYMTADPLSRIKSASPFIKCEEGYCSISLEHRGQYPGVFQTRGITVPAKSHILIQHDDYTNIKAIQAIVNAFISSPSCPVFKTVQCIDSSNQVVNPPKEQTGFGGYDGSKGFPDANEQ